MRKVRYPAVLKAQSEGGFTVTFLDFPEAVTEGDDRAQALANASEALSLVLLQREADGESVPHATDMEMVLPARQRRLPKPVRVGIDDLQPETRLWFLSIAQFDIQSAINAAQKAIDFDAEDVRCLEYSQLAVIRYSRPFLYCNTPSSRKSVRLELDCRWAGEIDEAAKNLHANVLEVRNKVVAHSDMSKVTVYMEGFEFDPQSGKTVRVGQVHHPWVPPQMLPDLISLARKILHQITAELHSMDEPFERALSALGLIEPKQIAPSDLD